MVEFFAERQNFERLKNREDSSDLGGRTILGGGGAQASKTFKWPKNREDSSDLDDFMLETTAATRSPSSKIFFAPALPEKIAKTSKTFAKPSSPPRGRWHGAAVKFFMARQGSSVGSKAALAD